jgi:hypothetical protein
MNVVCDTNFSRALIAATKEFNTQLGHILIEDKLKAEEASSVPSGANYFIGVKHLLLLQELGPGVW